MFDGATVCPFPRYLCTLGSTRGNQMPHDKITFGPNLLPINSLGDMLKGQ